MGADLANGNSGHRAVSNITSIHLCSHVAIRC
jgi:hypothetical protein